MKSDVVAPLGGVWRRQHTAFGPVVSEPPQAFSGGRRRRPVGWDVHDDHDDFKAVLSFGSSKSCSHSSPLLFISFPFVCVPTSSSVLGSPLRLFARFTSSLSTTSLAMAAEVFRDTIAGEFVRLFTGNRVLQYPEERADFVIPDKYLGKSSEPAGNIEKSGVNTPTPADGPAPATSGTATPSAAGSAHDDDATLHNQLAGESSDPEKSAKSAEPGPPKAKVPPGTIVVDWCVNTSLQERFNIELTAAKVRWSRPGKPDDLVQQEKGLCRRHALSVDLCRCDRTLAFSLVPAELNPLAVHLAVYVGSAIISEGTEDLMREFGVSEEAATLTISLYVIACEPHSLTVTLTPTHSANADGVGPLLFSPLSEIPRFGRNPFYIYPLILYVPFQAGAATVPTFGGLLALRFITGFLGSPALATGGASMQDMFVGFKASFAKNLALGKVAHRARRTDHVCLLRLGYGSSPRPLARSGDLWLRRRS